MTTNEPTAWAVYGRKTGALRDIVSDDETARDLAEYYDVVSLYPASPPPADDVREATDANLTRLREVWAALGCERNPNDFHASAQQSMWTQALSMIRDATAQTGRVYHENRRLEEALRVARVATPSPPANDVREALALTIAESFPGWSEDTTEPVHVGWSEALRLSAEKRNERVNEECLRQGREYADAILANRAFEVRPRGKVTDTGSAS